MNKAIDSSYNNFIIKKFKKNNFIIKFKRLVVNDK